MGNFPLFDELIIFDFLGGRKEPFEVQCSNEQELIQAFTNHYRGTHFDWKMYADISLSLFSLWELLPWLQYLFRQSREKEY